MKLWVKMLAVVGSVACLGGAGPAAAQTGDPSVVQTDKGLVQGFVRNGVLEFRGIPFAKSVAGDRRWTMPEPPQPWQGVRKAMHFVAPCAQAARYNLTERSDNEDCLALNVTVPESAGPLAGKKRPVIVWIHGGAFVGGSSSLYRLDALAKATGAVLVSMNYRVGVFGFMPHPAFDPERNGGHALEDQRLALRWVQQNIAAFGGNPKNVTLAGESAGAASVCMHVIAPEETDGLFHKAIIQSGACAYKLRHAAERNSLGVKVAETVGCKDPATVLSCLRTKDPQELIEAGDKAGAGELQAFTPVMGTKTLPRTGLESLRQGKFTKVAVLNGGTRDELRLYVAYAIQAGESITAGNYKDKLRVYYGDKADAIAAQYPVTGYSSPPAALGSVWTDFRPDMGINKCLYVETAKLMSAHGVNVYQWEFADRSAPGMGVAVPLLPDPGFELGAAHSTELNYYFPGYSNTTQLSAPDLTEGQQALADQMVAAWTAFVKDSAPVVKGVEWKPFKDSPRALRFEQGKVESFDPVADYQCGFWKGLYPEYLGN